MGNYRLHCYVDPFDIWPADDIENGFAACAAVTVAHVPAEISNSLKNQIKQHFNEESICGIALFTLLTRMSFNPHLYSHDF